MTHTIQRPPAMTMAMTNTHTQKKTKKPEYLRKCDSVFKLKHPVLMNIGWNILWLMTPTVHLTTDKCKDEDKDKEKEKHKDKNRDKVLKRLSILTPRIRYSCSSSSSSVTEKTG